MTDPSITKECSDLTQNDPMCPCYEDITICYREWGNGAWGDN